MTLGHARNTAIPVTSFRTGFRALSEWKRQKQLQKEADNAQKEEQWKKDIEHENKRKQEQEEREEEEETRGKMTQ